ncbi:MAG TPA: hypothetical protein VD969_04355 [Symbiobacteriaceae bacterium]|nr:hypothetical protein [Symbiobacteriaceae bacterium]
MLRGDSHRLYCRLRRSYPTPPRGPMAELNHVRTIAQFYAGLDPGERDLLLAWAKKEESGLGLIPAALSGIPLLGLIFTPFMEKGIRSMPAWTWVLLWLVGALMLTAGIYIHYRQKAWSTLHVQLLEQFRRQQR